MYDVDVYVSSTSCMKETESLTVAGRYWNWCNSKYLIMVGSKFVGTKFDGRGMVGSKFVGSLSLTVVGSGNRVRSSSYSIKSKSKT